MPIPLDHSGHVEIKFGSTAHTYIFRANYAKLRDSQGQTYLVLAIPSTESGIDYIMERWQGK